MLDAKIRPLIDPPLNWLGRVIAAFGISANITTISGLVLGLGAAFCLALGVSTWWVLLFLLASRLADGLDGAVARATHKTDYGGYLDIFCDFVFYGAIPMAFVLRDPVNNAMPGAFLLFSFYMNAASFLGYAVMAEKRGMKTDAQGHKSLYYAAGLLEGAETIGFFILIGVIPSVFPYAAFVFACLCIVTAVSRLLYARNIFS